MSKESSVAPKERVNITYTPATGDGQEQVELPMKMLVVGDFVGREDERSLEERKPINVNKETFSSVMAEQDLSLSLQVKDHLTEDDPDGELALNLKFESLRDMSPEGVARQVPEMRRLMELRDALTALKGPLGNVPSFRKKIQGLLEDESSRRRLMDELGVHVDRPPLDAQDDGQPTHLVDGEERNDD